MHQIKTKYEDYILANQETQYESCGETYAKAAEELLVPYPSIPLEGFPVLSRLTGGLRPREFSIICGATGIGKTTLIANLSKTLLLQRVPQFVASVETGRTDYMKRIISAIIKKDWNTGDPVSLEEFKQFHCDHIQKFETGSLKFSLYESRFSVESLINDIARMKQRYDIKVAIIDNLNFFLDVKRSSDQILEMDRVIHSLIEFCKVIDVHIIMIMHPRKTDGARITSEYDIKGSSTAVQEAHNIFLFNRIDQDLIDSGHAKAGDRELKIAKMRRRGRAIGTRIVLKAVNGVAYEEGSYTCAT